MLSCEKNSVTIQMPRRRARSWRSAIVLLATFLPTMSTRVYGEDTPKATDHDDIEQLIQSNQRLSLQVQDLQARVNQLEAKSSEPVAASLAAASVTVPPRTTPPVGAAAAASTSVPAAQEPQSDISAPRVRLRLFGDVGYGVSDRKGETNSFHIGSLDLFVTGSLSERVSVLGSVLFIPQPNNSIAPDVERLLLQYKHNDHFTFAIGRYHSAIGYYNTIFHQGAWFQNAIDRPFMYEFDDQGGFLPMQEVGITVNGQIPSGKLGLNYVAEMGNGRAHLLGIDPAQNTQDSNNGKSFNFALFARPRWVPGLQAGFSIYHDRLTFSDNINHDELISTVHVVYTNSNYEFLNEGLLVRHTGSKTGTSGVFHTPGFYTQISRKFGQYRPYFRYAYVNAGVAEPIYGDPADGPLVGRRNGPSIGIRYDFNEHAAAKLEYERLGRRDQPSSNGLESQFSFAF